MNEELRQHIEAYKNGDKVTSVEMGGLGDDYETVIQDLAIEIMCFLQTILPHEKEHENEAEVESITDYILDHISSDKYEGMTGAQVGAAQNLAFMFWKNTPSKAIELLDDYEKDRIITIQKPDWL